MARKQPLSIDEFKTICSKVTRLCVDLVIKTDQGYLLTLRQKNGWIGQWHLPGGTVHYREKIEGAVKRIAKEELGIEVAIEKFVKYIEYFNEEKERGYGYSVSLVFLCKPCSTNFNVDDEVQRMGFFKSAPENTIREQKEFLEKYF